MPKDSKWCLGLVINRMRQKDPYSILHYKGLTILIKLYLLKHYTLFELAHTQARDEELF